MPSQSILQEQKRVTWVRRQSMVDTSMPTCFNRKCVSAGIYLTACFGAMEAIPRCLFLFPGPSQDICFPSIFMRVLTANQPLVALMGNNLQKVGTHLIRKVGVSYLFHIFIQLFSGSFYVFDGGFEVKSANAGIAQEEQDVVVRIA